MNQETDPRDDALFESLADLVDDLSPAADRVHAELWRQTSRVQRGRRWRRRGGQALLLVAVFAGGFFTAQGWQTPPAAGPDDGVASVPDPDGQDAPPPWLDDVRAPSSRPEPTDPVHLERLARTGSPPLRRQRLLQAGDLYLSQGSDVTAALRCYREVLDLMPEDDRGNVAPDDTWLLVALKQDQRTRS